MDLHRLNEINLILVGMYAETQLVEQVDHELAISNGIGAAARRIRNIADVCHALDQPPLEILNGRQ